LDADVEVVQDDAGHLQDMALADPHSASLRGRAEMAPITVTTVPSSDCNEYKKESLAPQTPPLHPGERVAASAQHPYPPHPRPRVDFSFVWSGKICWAVDVVTGNTLPRAMSALSYQLVTVTNCAAAVALCVATARDGCRSTNLRRPNNGRERNRSFHSRPAQRRSMLRWRMLATNVAQPISRPCDG
jgi:hypothetical protein